MYICTSRGVPRMSSIQTRAAAETTFQREDLRVESTIPTAAANTIDSADSWIVVHAPASSRSVLSRTCRGSKRAWKSSFTGRAASWLFDALPGGVIGQRHLVAEPLHLLRLDGAV